MIRRRLHPNGSCGGRKPFVGIAALFCAVFGLLALGAAARGQEEDLSELLKNAKPVKPPEEVTDPSTQAAASRPDPLGTVKAKPPTEARTGTVTLNTGKKYEGRVWTTLQTPLRFWIESSKTYRDVDWSLIKRLDVVVEYERMEDDWRWLKEGSDVKVFSGKKYPNVSLGYKATLVNEQVIEGTIVAPIFVFDGEKPHALALYKKYKGKLDETLKDLVYIRSIQLSLSDKAAEGNEKKTTRLPLIEE